MKQGDISRQLRLGDWGNLRAELDWIYDGAVEPAYRTTAKQSSGQSAFLVRRGSVSIRTARGVRSAGPGQWILPTQGNRFQRFSNDARILSIHLNFEWPGGQPLFAWEVAGLFAAKDAPKLESQSLKLLRLVRSRFPHAKELLPRKYCSFSDYVLIRDAFAGWLRIFVDALLEQGFLPTRQGEIDPRILETIQAIDRLPIGESFQEKILAGKVNLSTHRLDRLFVRQFGLTPRRHFEQRKLNLAIALVRSSKPIKEIAFELGFTSLPHFSGWFRQRAGLSPRQFRAQTASAYVEDEA